MECRFIDISEKSIDKSENLSVHQLPLMQG